MKNYMVTHTFKSKEMKAKFNETVASMKMEDIVKSMTSDKAACQMTWNTPGDTMQMFCWWKANSEADINNQLGQMNDFFEPHKLHVRYTTAKDSPLCVVPSWYTPTNSFLNSSLTLFSSASLSGGRNCVIRC